ncbi:hypothetical protein [Streptomyces sp. NBC_01262]|uniref:hypothetical protein n=1 Tax=Streptomyces sp. NBC_01262 TaxID=2903803 RepID=UPI002E353AE6|nr:hypothetical protein [Streptomyces sp. NBC_01262]
MTDTREGAAHARGSGICSRCQTHTRDGVVYPIYGEASAGGRVVFCADLNECDERRRG